jgi:LPS sulfotransferase NodH
MFFMCGIVRNARVTQDSTASARKLYDLATPDHDYPAWSGPPRRTILICTHPRSGSTLLGEAIYFAGGLGCPLEYFHAGFRPTLARYWHAETIGDYIAAVWRNRTDPGGTLSVKLFWRDMVDLALELDRDRFAALEGATPEQTTPETYRALAALLAPLFPAPEFVHLQRTDRLRQAVSAVTARDTGNFRAIPGVGENAPLAEPSFDYAQIERMIGYSDFCHHHWRNFFTAIGETPVSLSYEQVVGDYDRSIGALLTRLGSTGSPPPARMQRQADGRSEAFVLQYLREYAARTAARG